MGGWHEESIVWATPESPRFFEVRFWSHDVDAVVGRLNEGMEKVFGNGYQFFVELRQMWAGTANICIEAEFATFLLNMIKENFPHYEKRKKENLQRFDLAMTCLKEEGSGVFDVAAVPLPPEKMSKKDRMRVM